MTEQQLLEASTLWKAGASMADILAVTGATSGSMKHHTRTNRTLFPERLCPWFRAKAATSTFERRDDTMRWITHSGAIVTLPRVSILEKQG